MASTSFWRISNISRRRHKFCFSNTVMLMLHLAKKVFLFKFSNKLAKHKLLLTSARSCFSCIGWSHQALDRANWKLSLSHCLAGRLSPLADPQSHRLGPGLHRLDLVHLQQSHHRQHPLRTIHQHTRWMEYLVLLIGLWNQLKQVDTYNSPHL